jgi:hypothetical protein
LEVWLSAKSTVSISRVITTVTSVSPSTLTASPQMRTRSCFYATLCRAS